MGAKVYAASTPWKRPLWFCSAAVMIAAGLMWFSEPWYFSFFALLSLFLAWALVFDRARRATFHQLHALFPEQMQHYASEYHFIRYRIFLGKLQHLPDIRPGNIERALEHLETDLETQPTWAVSSHPVIVAILGSFFAILGGASGRWDVKYLLVSLFALLAAVYFSYMVLGLLRTRKSDLLEFKRFLLWAKIDWSSLTE